jgi:hypothetical protein
VSSHRAAFDICNTLIAADTGAAGLNNVASVNHLFGGFARVGDPQRTNALPYIDMEIASEREVDAFIGQRVDMVIRFHVYTDRNTVYQSTAGGQDAVVRQLRIVFHKITGATSDSWVPNMFNRISGQQAPASDTTAHYVETYQLRMNRTTPVA